MMQSDVVGVAQNHRKFLEIRCSKIASESILRQKQSHSSYMACGV